MLRPDIHTDHVALPGQELAVLDQLSSPYGRNPPLGLVKHSFLVECPPRLSRESRFGPETVQTVAPSDRSIVVDDWRQHVPLLSGMPITQSPLCTFSMAMT